MNDSERRFEGIWIPAGIWANPNIKANEKVLLSSFSNNGETVKSLKETHFYFETHKILSMLRSLVSRGVVRKEVMSYEQAYKKLSMGHNVGCEFCGYTKSFLDDHHYPIKKSDGGSETIPLCANCHREFHQLTDYGVYFYE